MVRERKEHILVIPYSILDKSSKHQQFDLAEVFRHISNKYRIQWYRPGNHSVSVTSTRSW